MTMRSEEGDIDILLDNGRYQISFHVPSIFRGIIMGKKGIKKQSIELETNTSIYIPRHQEVGNIEIRGKSREETSAAYLIIKDLVARARSKHNCNRFISIPVGNPAVRENFHRFKEEVMNRCSECFGIDERLFQNPAKFHLTVGVMMLADDEENELAVNTLISSKQDVLNQLFHGCSLKVRIRGIDIMNDDPSKTKVVYAKVEDSSGGLLQQYMDKMVDYFVKAGLMKKERAHVTLHVTLMNSYFLMKKLYGETLPKGKWHGFDARRIIECYKDYDFGTVEINEVHLSQDNSATEEGYYIASYKIAFQ